MPNFLEGQNVQKGLNIYGKITLASQKGNYLWVVILLFLYLLFLIIIAHLYIYKEEKGSASIKLFDTINIYIYFDDTKEKEAVPY